MIKKPQLDNVYYGTTHEIDLNKFVKYDDELCNIIKSVEMQLEKIFTKTNDKGSFVTIILNNNTGEETIYKTKEEIQEDPIILKQLIKLNFEKDLKLEVIKRCNDFDLNKLIHSYKFMKSDKSKVTKFSKNYIDSQILSNTINAVFNSLEKENFEFLPKLKSLNQSSRNRLNKKFDYQKWDIEEVATSFQKFENKTSEDSKNYNFFVIENTHLEDVMRNMSDYEEIDS
jgi:hypothetical protein